jgi:hypothetical protein
MVKQFTGTVHQQNIHAIIHIASDKITDLIWIVELALTQWPKITGWSDAIILKHKGERLS